MHMFKFRDQLINLTDRPLLSALWKECRPKILVVTDQLSYSAVQGFGLTQFVETLVTSTIHGMTPLVTKAARGGTLTGADINDFKFDDANHGVLKSRYDVVFILGFVSENVNQLPQAEIDALARFMQAGGGVFATGDHQSLGASISRDLPRVRNMRRWTEATTPHVANENRLSTNISGPNEIEEFSDQSDTSPQRLYLNYRTEAGGLRNPHPLAQQVPPRRALEVFPDHPHEGECMVPSNLGTTFSLDGANADEWPVAAGTATRVSPEVVALTMSHGDGFPFGPTGAKQPLVPRSFIAICAYDGQRANVGRVVTDATWHHFVNINLDGSGQQGFLGLREPSPVPGDPPIETDALFRIRQYYRNLATWLMPKNVRYCLRFPKIILELARFPLFEEFDLPRPPEWTGPHVRDLGMAVADSLGRHMPPWEVQALMQDALEEAIGPQAVARLTSGERVGSLVGNDLGYAALGGFVGGIVATLEEAKDVEALRPHESFERAAAEGAKAGIKLALAEKHKEVEAMHAALKRIEV